MTDGNAAILKYLLVEFHVKDKNHKDFCDQMPELIGLFVKHFKWELMQALYPVSGRVNRFVHIWRITDEASVNKLMVDGAVTLGSRKKRDPARSEFFEAYHKIQLLVDKTRHVFMTSLPHDPGFLGEQTQTVLVDEDKKLFLFEHADLRSKEIKRLEPKGSLNEYLQSGAATGRLGSKALFFNFAALKPLSLFQEQNLKDPHDRRLIQKRTESTPHPRASKTIVLAAPWGDVYEIGPEALGHIAREIESPQLQPTAELVKELILGGVPIATIPTSTSLTVGEGCVCYVINLNSFV